MLRITSKFMQLQYRDGTDGAVKTVRQYRQVNEWQKANAPVTAG